MTSALRSLPANVAPRLSAALAGLRRRRRLRGLLMAVLAAAATGLVVLLAARLALQVTALPVSPELLASLAALVVGLIGLAVASLRSPALEDVARSTDSALSLDERVSSALEVAGDWPRENNVITSALIEDVERRAEGFDPRRLVPLRTRAMTATAAAAILAGIGALLVPAAANVPQGSVGIEATGPATEDESATIDDAEIRQLADLVRKDAERRNNELLEAIANSMEKLASEAANGRPQEEVSEQLRELIEMAKQAYGGSMPDWMPPEPGDFAELDRRLEAEQNKPEQQIMQGTPYENAYEMGYYAPRDFEERNRNSFTPEELKNLGMSQGDGDAPIDPNFGQGDASSIDPSLPFEAKPLEGDEEVMATPAGAAADSSKGDAQMAGGGDEGMTAEDLARAEYQASDDMSIRSDKPDSQGKRIRLELPPDAQASAAADANLGPGERSRAETDAVDRSLVDAQARAVVARYFARKQG